jgi:hypothetical protein
LGVYVINKSQKEPTKLFGIALMRVIASRMGTGVGLCVCVSYVAAAGTKVFDHEGLWLIKKIPQYSQGTGGFVAGK